MDIDNIYDNIFDETVEDDSVIFDDVINWVFPISCKKKKESNYYSNGTGFFVNKSGYFITAGHVVQDYELECFAVIDNEHYKFKTLFLEYLNIESQVGSICRDLAICKLDIEKNIDFYLSSEYPTKTTTNISGYRSTHQGKLAINPIKNGDYYLHNYTVEFGMIKNEIKQKYSTDFRNKCSNIRSLKLDEGIKYDGLSGGPVYSEKLIYGMLIGDLYITSNYIISKLLELGIDFNK